jgi:hypothetical protein
MFFSVVVCGIENGHEHLVADGSGVQLHLQYTIGSFPNQFLLLLRREPVHADDLSNLP